MCGDDKEKEKMFRVQKTNYARKEIFNSLAAQIYDIRESSVLQQIKKTWFVNLFLPVFQSVKRIFFLNGFHYARKIKWHEVNIQLVLILVHIFC